MSTLHCALEYGAELYVNERQKIRYYRARSTEEIRRRMPNHSGVAYVKLRYFPFHQVCHSSHGRSQGGSGVCSNSPAAGCTLEFRSSSTRSDHQVGLVAPGAYKHTHWPRNFRGEKCCRLETLTFPIFGLTRNL